jgi:hypothetical protein
VELGVYLKKGRTYRHVHGHTGEQADDHIKPSQRTICRIHVRACNLVLAGNERSTTMCDDNSPQEQCQEGWRHNDGLHEEQDSELLDWHQSQCGLAHPVEEEAQKASSYMDSQRTWVIHELGEGHTSDASTFRKMIGEVPEARPDGFDAILKEGASLHAKNCSPPLMC